MFLRRPTPLRQSKSSFSIMSYNILAPIYVRPVDKRTGKIQEFAAFRWVTKDDVLDVGKRERKLRKQIQDSQADIVCLQEVQFVKNEEEKQWELPLYLQMKDFGCVLPCDKDLDVMVRLFFLYTHTHTTTTTTSSIQAKRNLRVLNKHAPVANAILFRHDRFEMVSEISTRNQRVSATFRHLSAKGEKLFVRFFLFHSQVMRERERERSLRYTIYTKHRLLHSILMLPIRTNALPRCVSV